MALVLDGVPVRQRGETWLHDIRLELSSGMTTLSARWGRGRRR